MKLVKCKSCRRVIGESDGRVFFRDARPVNSLPCECGAVRKFHGKRQRPAPMIFHDASFTVRLSG
jgi:RNase P subunit RPR2